MNSPTTIQHTDPELKILLTVKVVVAKSLPDAQWPLRRASGLKRIVDFLHRGAFTFTEENWVPRSPIFEFLQSPKSVRSFFRTAIELTWLAKTSNSDYYFTVGVAKGMVERIYLNQQPTNRTNNEEKKWNFDLYYDDGGDFGAAGLARSFHDLPGDGPRAVFCPKTWEELKDALPNLANDDKWGKITPAMFERAENAAGQYVGMFITADKLQTPARTLAPSTEKNFEPAPLPILISKITDDDNSKKSDHRSEG
jgi:hypothetical protein